MCPIAVIGMPNTCDTSANSSADGAGDEDPLPWMRSASPDDPAGGDIAERHDGDRERARRRVRVAADQMHAIFRLIDRKTARESRHPVFLDGVRQREIEHIRARLSALGGEIRQIDALRAMRSAGSSGRK
jgi:hypothetical protein